MKRFAFVALLIVALLAVACGPSATPAAAPTVAPVAPTTPPKAVKLTVWHQWAGDYLTAIKAAFDDYTKKNPNVTFDLSKPDDVQAALKVAIPAGQGPDIIGWANDNIGTQALAGSILALNDYGIDEAFLKSTYEPAAVKGVIWTNKVWGLPESQEGIALVYNKALAKAEDFPSDPKNFDDLVVSL